jgi:Tol biopolymer transport system component
MAPSTKLITLTAAGALALTVLPAGCGSAGKRHGDSRATVTQTRPSAPTASAAGLRGLIVFARAGNAYGDETIFIANADGSDQRQLTKPGVSCCPRISRDGKRVLFSAPGPGNRVTTGTVAPDRSGYREARLPDSTANLGPGAWSPDGKHIAFQLWDDQDHARDGIYTGLPGGGRLSRVTHARGGADIPGDYSPDGKQLAFFREGDVQGVGSVWVVSVDGSGLKRLSPRKMVAGWGTVRWSPDGREILFQSGGKEPEGSLWTVHPDGSGLRRVFHAPKGRFAISPAWSPSGAQIMFALDPTGDEFTHPINGMYAINADGSRLRLVMGTKDFKREPDWIR